MTPRLVDLVNGLIEELDVAFNSRHYTQAGLIIEALDALNSIGKQDVMDEVLQDCGA